jgi:hypothetical protein
MEGLAVRLLLLCLIPCCLLAAAPTAPSDHLPPPGRPVAVITDEGEALPDAEQMKRLAQTNPVAFLEECLVRYQRDVQGYALTLHKRERIDGELQKPEDIRVAFRVRPHSAYLEWVSGARQASRVLYVEGENDDKLLALPRLLPLAVALDVDGDRAHQAGRFTLREFGLAGGLRRAHADWKAAREQGALHVAYDERPLEPVGGRPCHVLHRTEFRAPERDGITEQTLYIDRENWLLIGSVAKGAAGLIGEYYFRDVRLNPEFGPEQFTPAALKPRKP